MANRYEHHHNIHNQRSIFLPMFCRLSIKDVKLNSHRKPHAAEAVAAGEPSSPKVSCMGQVKRKNRVIGYPAATISAAGHNKYMITNRSKSGRTLLPGTAGAPVPGVGGRSRSCRISQEVRAVKFSRRSRATNDLDREEVVDISEMDPPLPVVKRVAPPGGFREEVNLWRRRFSGVGGGLQSLEIEKIRLPPDARFQPPPSLTA